jgi:uncharacterized protein involved in exopolysaccharide biosynthesis
VLGCVAIGLIAAGVTAFLLPSYYRSGAAFQAETNPPTRLSGALAGLASEIGNLQLGSQNNAQFFGDLLKTDAVLRRVAQANYPWREDSATLATIYGFDDEPPALQSYHVVRQLRAALSVDVTIRTGVVRFSLEARTPRLAYALTASTLAALNEANVELRRTRAAAERRFTADRATQARRELDSTEQVLAQFYARNRMIAGSPHLQMEEARLRRAVDMAQQVYVQLRVQEEQAALQEVRNTPAVSVIDPPVLAVKRARPDRRLAIALGALVGILLAAARLLFAA